MGLFVVSFDKDTNTTYEYGACVTFLIFSFSVWLVIGIVRRVGVGGQEGSLFLFSVLVVGEAPKKSVFVFFFISVLEFKSEVLRG